MSDGVTSNHAECPNCPYELDQQTLVEPELDGDLQYYECEECGHTWGWKKIEATDPGSCSLGVPEDVRRRASVGMESTLSRGAPVIAGPTLKIGPPS